MAFMHSASHRWPRLCREILILVFAKRIRKGLAGNDAAVLLLAQLGLAPGRPALRLRREGRGLAFTKVEELRAPVTVALRERCHYLPL